MTPLVKKLLNEYSITRFGMYPLDEEHYQMLVVEFLTEIGFLEVDVAPKPDRD
jgi:hypothetical protein